MSKWYRKRFVGQAGSLRRVGNPPGRTASPAQDIILPPQGMTFSGD
jgi:hypothetical protein